MDMFQMLQYQAWESTAMKEYSALLDKYSSLKEKETSVLEQKGIKTGKKDMLLKFKADNTLSKMGNLELELIEKEENAESYCNAQILQAQQKFEAVRDFFLKQKEQSLSKTKREYDAKKRNLEQKGESIEQLRTIDIKSGAEISIEKQKYELLSKMNDIVMRMDMSRSQCGSNATFSGDIPKLPEPFAKRKDIVPESSKPVMNIETAFEDASLAIMREESRREDARLRREAMEEEMMMKEKALAYRKQLDEEAKERRKRNEEARKQEEKEDEDEWAEENEECERLNALKQMPKSKKQVKMALKTLGAGVQTYPTPIVE
jgi:hypothetical protein